MQWRRKRGGAIPQSQERGGLNMFGLPKDPIIQYTIFPNLHLPHRKKWGQRGMGPQSQLKGDKTILLFTIPI